MSASRLPRLLSVRQLAVVLKTVRLVDATWCMPASGRVPSQEFLHTRIPGASFFGIDVIKEAVAKMGISNNDQIVVYDNSDVRSACRVYWSFKVFGHGAVSVLDGGLQHWIRAGFETESGMSAHISPANFHAQYNADKVTPFEQMNSLINTPTSQLLDARNYERFTGIAPEPRPGMPSGHMPTSLNLPFGDLFDQKTGLFLPKQQLLERFQSKGINLDKPIVASCGTGITASVLLFALDVLGAKHLSLYDGSWVEWTTRNGKVE